MAPRQLRLEPIEADSTADKGAKRVRVDSTEESSTQVHRYKNPARATARYSILALARTEHCCPL
eukprot:scaffold12489_cov145-Isochrysis_galbana.AAC.8